MIDIHCHILNNIDDGPSQMEIAIEMASIAAADKINTIIATPHIHSKQISPKDINIKVNELNINLKQRQIPVEILQGAEILFQLDPKNIKGYTLCNSSYVLVEFPHSHFPANAATILFNLRINGYYPIIAHPERNPTVIKNPKILANLLDSGIYTQVTAASLCGRFGKAVEKCAITLLKNNAVHFIATDAHSPEVRKPILSTGLKIAEKIIGTENAIKLVTTNPEAILSNTILSSE